MYANGRGMEVNFEKTFEYFVKAAELGDGEAMYFLAVMYSNGDGIEANAATADMWYQKALENGYEGQKTSDYSKEWIKDRAAGPICLFIAAVELITGFAVKGNENKQAKNKDKSYDAEKDKGEKRKVEKSAARSCSAFSFRLITCCRGCR